MVKWMLRLILRLAVVAGAKLGEIERREALATALRPGTLVIFSGCPCPYDHQGFWRIDRYNHDAGDYHIVRMGDGKSDYAVRKVLKIIQVSGV